jgi:hypothetical protein
MWMGPTRPVRSVSPWREVPCSGCRKEVSRKCLVQDRSRPHAQLLIIAGDRQALEKRSALGWLRFLARDADGSRCARFCADEDLSESELRRRGELAQQRGTSARIESGRIHYRHQTWPCFDRASAAGLDTVDGTNVGLESEQRFYRLPRISSSHDAVSVAFAVAILTGVGFSRGSFMTEDELTRVSFPARALVAACSPDLGRFDPEELIAVRDELRQTLTDYDPDRYPTSLPQDVQALVRDLFHGLAVCSWYALRQTSLQLHSVWSLSSLEGIVADALPDATTNEEDDIVALDDLPPFLLMNLPAGTTCTRIGRCRARPLRRQIFRHVMLDAQGGKDRVRCERHYEVQGVIWEIDGRHALRWAFDAGDEDFIINQYDHSTTDLPHLVARDREEHTWWMALPEDAEAKTIVYGRASE